jgi:hypothetical protein
MFLFMCIRMCAYAGTYLNIRAYMYGHAQPLINEWLRQGMLLFNVHIYMYAFARIVCITSTCEVHMCKMIYTLSDVQSFVNFPVIMFSSIS